MVISNYTKPELEYFWENCNFVGAEREVFDLRSQGIPLEVIAETLNLSIDGAKRISRKVNSKIITVRSLDGTKTIHSKEMLYNVTRKEYNNIER